MSDYEHLIYEQRGPVLDRKNLQLSFDTKAIGPAMLAKHFAPQMNTDGSFVLFSGVPA
ncbi:MAG: hypothetical protein QOD36_2480, partial [Mycobacterium sp.]|nr:hypothetical protein [Mycobacterium sp.]